MYGRTDEHPKGVIMAPAAFAEFSSVWLDTEHKALP